MKKITIVCMFVSLILMLTLTACATDAPIKKYIENEISTIESTDECLVDDSFEVITNTNDQIIGHWIIDSVKFNNIVYKIDELKNLLDEASFNALQLEFEFTKHEVTIYINGENKAITGYKIYKEDVDPVEMENKKSDIIRYIDESDQLIFTLIDNTLQIDQSQSTLILTKQTKNTMNDNVTTDTSVIHEIE